MTLAPIIVFTYNRLSHVKALIESLQQNELAKDSQLFIFSDGGKKPEDIRKVSEVRSFLHAIQGFHSVEINESETNRGLANSVIHGVTQVLQQYDKVIVLEDDLILSPYYLRFMNEALDVYEKDERVGTVNGHMLDLKGIKDETFFIHHIDSWGWGTWRRSWDLFEANGSVLLKQLEERNLCKAFDFDGAYPFVRMLKRQIAGQNNSWAIRYRASMFLSNKLSVNAGRSLVINNGADGSGTHLKKGVLFPDGPLTKEPINVTYQVPVEDMQARKAFRRYYLWNNSKVHKAIVMMQNWFN